jgi:hypothetical protein
MELLSYHEYAYEYVCVDFFHNVSGAGPREHQELCANIMRIKGWCKVVYIQIILCLQSERWGCQHRMSRLLM